jgi:hypothetical protein
MDVSGHFHAPPLGDCGPSAPLGGPQSWSARSQIETNFLPIQKSNWIPLYLKTLLLGDDEILIQYSQDKL